MKQLMLILLASLVVSCSNSPEIKQTWLDKDIFSKNLSGTLVVAKTEQLALRKTFEREFVTELTNHGIEAKASHVIGNGKLNSEDIIAYAKKNNLDTILVTHYAGADQTELYHRGTTYYRFNHLYGRPYEVAHIASYKTTNKDIMLITTLYQTSNKEVLWDAVATARLGGDPQKLFSPFVNAFVKQLQKDALVK